MFDEVFLLFALVLILLFGFGIAGFVSARRANRRLDAMEARFAAVDSYLTAFSAYQLGRATDPAATQTPAEAPQPDLFAAPPPAPVSGPPPIDRPLPQPVAPIPASASVPVVAATPPPPPPARDLESTLGTRWTVWVGGLALALGGIFLVRYSIEQGLLGPEMRLALAALAGLGLCAAAEVLLRRGHAARAEGLGLTDIPSILLAAGISTLFATAYAAHGLYGFIGPAAAVFLMVAIAAGAILGALRHAPWLAGLGLLGGYVAPILASTGGRNFWPVVILSAALTATAFALARLKGWSAIAVLGLAGHAAWAGLMYLVGTGGDAGPAMVQIAVLAVLVTVFGGITARIGTNDYAPSDADARIAVTGAIVAMLHAAAFVALYGARHGHTVALVTTLVLFAGAVVAPRLRANAIVAAVLAIVTVATYEAILPVVADGRLVDPRTLGVVRNDAIDPLLWLSFGFAALFGLGGGLAALRTRDGPIALAAAATPVAILGVAYLRFRHLGYETGFAIAAMALAAANTFVAEMLVSRLKARRSGLLSLPGLYAAAGAACLGLALAFLVPRGGLPLGFALAALGIAAVWTRRPLRLLKVAAGLAGALVLAALALDPEAIKPGPNALPVVNALASGLLMPALALGTAAFLLGRKRTHWAPAFLEGAAALLALAYLWLAVSHALGPPYAVFDTADRTGIGLRIVLFAGAAYLIERVAAARSSRTLGVAAAAGFAVAIALALYALVVHPLLGKPVPRGGVILNDLILAYLIPGLVLGALALARRRRGGADAVAAVAEVAGHALLLAYGMAQIAVLFRGVDLAGSLDQAEFSAYSVLFLGYGVALLAAGLVTGRRSLRLASAAVVIATVVKVFLIDMAGLTGLWRAVSFLGLGIVLIGIGLLYQRLLIRRASPPVTPPV